MRVLIIDDEDAARQLLKIYLKEHADCEIVGEASDGFDGFRLVRELNPDVIFLDIQMPRITGFEMLELLEKPPAIIFATAYDQYAIKAFEKNAADYLLKPFSKDRLTQALDKVRARLQTLGTTVSSPEIAVSQSVREEVEYLERIAVKMRNKVHVVPVDIIQLFEAEGDYVQIHTPEGKYLKEFTMKYLEAHLSPEQFVRVHRSNIVAINSVKGLEHTGPETWMVRLKNGVGVKASVDGVRQLKKVLGL